MKVLYRLASGLWIVFDPKNINYNIIWGFIIFVALATTGIWWYWDEGDKEFLYKEGVASLEIDPGSKLPIYKIGVSEPFDSLKVQAALYEKDFLFSGTPITIIFESQPQSNGEYQYDARYSGIFPLQCVGSVEQALKSRSVQIARAGNLMRDRILNAKAAYINQLIDLGKQIQDFDAAMQTIDLPSGTKMSLQEENMALAAQIPTVEQIVDSSCGNSVFFQKRYPMPNTKTLNSSPTEAIATCLGDGQCSPCQIVEGHERLGNCKPTLIEVKNNSKVVYDDHQRQRRISFNLDPVAKLPY